jgi:preprotein translocase subunit YajC
MLDGVPGELWEHARSRLRHDGWLAIRRAQGKDVGVDQYAGLILLAVPVFFFYLVISRSRRQQRVLAAAQDAVRPGSRVMTTSGLHATVVSLEDDSIVVLEIAPGVHTRWARLAIAQIFDDDDAATPATGQAAVLDLTADTAKRGGEPSGHRPNVKQDDNDLRSDDDLDDRTLT